MSSGYTIRIRVAILFFTLLSLAIAGLSSANARFAVILRDRARSNLIDPTNPVLDNNFQSLQNNVLAAAVITAVLLTMFAIYGAVIAVYPKWLRESDIILRVYSTLGVILAVVMIVLGGYTADKVRGFQNSFEKFGANDSIPYYGMMYWGGVAQAAYGSVLVFFTVISVILFSVLHHFKVRENRAKIAVGAASANNSGKETHV